MRSFRFLALAAVAAALIVVAPAIGDSGTARQSAVPPAQAAGGDAPPLIPSIVNTRLVRAQAALDNATGDVDSGQAAQAVAPMGAAVDNLTKGWNAEKWLIQTTPPPPADDAISDGDGGVIAYATPEDTAVAVFSAQHNLVSTAVGMMETGNAALLTSLTNSITTVGNSRTAAIKYIHSIAPPPPADDAVGDGLEGVATWDTVMPTTVAFLDDEIQQITGRLALYKFSASAKAALQKALGRAQTAKALVNQYWPPVLDD
jgi:hypothetical protein